MDIMTGEQVVAHLRGNHVWEAVCIEGVYDGGTLSYERGMEQFWLNFIWDDGDPIEVDDTLLSCKWRLTAPTKEIS
jgi:hypothetical protein